MTKTTRTHRRRHRSGPAWDPRPLQTYRDGLFLTNRELARRLNVFASTLGDEHTVVNFTDTSLFRWLDAPADRRTAPLRHNRLAIERFLEQASQRRAS